MTDSMDRGAGVRRSAWMLALALALAWAPSPATAAKVDPDGLDEEKVRAAMPEYFQRTRSGTGPMEIPDVFGPGAVLNVGNVHMKVTNWGHVGNLFTNVSSDPAGQWPGASGVSYLSTIRLAIGAVNPLTNDPVQKRRVSYLLEWRPPTLDPEDRMYRAYDGIIYGTRFGNDDDDVDPLTGRARVDEDFLDGRDNDGDGETDEDYAALGQQMWTCVIRDDTPQAINAVFNEKHVPLGLEVHQSAWAYSIPGFQDFNAVHYKIFNRSGHELDSVYVGWLVDMDAGPEESANFFSDDADLAGYPSGQFVRITTDSDKRKQDWTMQGSGASESDSALCPRFNLRVNAFSIADNDGDEGRTTGVPTFLLVNHTIDPLNCGDAPRGNAPCRVGFRAFRSFTSSTPFTQGGNPIVDQQRYEFLSGTATPTNVSPETGFIDAVPGDQRGDYIQWASVGPFTNFADGATIEVTIAFAVKEGTLTSAAAYPGDYNAFQAGSMTGDELLEAHPSLDNALSIQIAYEGIYESRPSWPELTFGGHGRETPIRAPRGTGSINEQDCRDLSFRTITETQPDPEWFDFDCDFCTGAWNATTGEGYFHRTWNADAPPPSPTLNLAASYNYTDNPDNRVVAGGDGRVTLAWDNLSEISADPKTGWFDFRGYRVWKTANWRRPVGSAGPADNDWSLIGEFRMFDYKDVNRVPIERNYTIDPGTGAKVCPKLFVPNFLYPDGRRDTATVDLCLDRFDLYDRQSGLILRPDSSVACVGDPDCEIENGCILGQDDCSSPGNRENRTAYPVGRYRLVDTEVKNGFVYFYSVTAFDSTGFGSAAVELSGRRSAVEAEGVVPQVGTRTGKGVWVVPNPYRGLANISDRPSSWDLTPNAADPTGTHIDFFGMPPGEWTIKIFTISGDLVATLHSTDPVNESLRGTVAGSDGIIRQGVTRQQDNENDGQARWNLITRNGQDVVSGIYMFTVESGQGTQRGKFVIIR